MGTIGEAITAAEERQFVGRQRELTVFRGFAAGGGTGAAMLHVSGPGGCGKSALLRAFGRLAPATGIETVVFDGSVATDADRFLDGLRSALGGVADPVSALNDRHPVVLVDGLESMGELTPFLQSELLPILAREVKIVVASRQPLGRLWAGWAELVEQVRLGGLVRVEVDEYLAKRGIDDPRLAEEIWGASFGHPLAVALAADMVTQLGVQHFAAHADWHLAVRNLAANVLQDVDDVALVTLLEAASVVRQFDESLLGAMTGHDFVGPAFVRLCQLSVVRAGDLGLALHDELRHILADDLRWRDPSRAQDYRRRAVAHLRARMRTAQPDEARRLAVEQMFFLEDAFLHGRVFNETTPGVWVHAPRPDAAHIREVHKEWVTMVASSYTPPPADELSDAFVDRLIDYPGTQFNLARTRDGDPIAYGFLLPLTADAMDLFDADGTLGPLIACWAGNGYEPPAAAADATAHLMSTIAVAGPDGLAGLAAVTRAGLEFASHPARFLAATRDPMYAHFASTMGFHPWPGASRSEDGYDDPVVLYELDLLGAGVEALLDSIVEGRPLPRTFWGVELERQLERALSCWDDAVALAGCGLAGWAGLRIPGDTPPAAKVQAMILGALESVAASHGEDGRQACRAIELGFLHADISQDAAATRMSVSRATFYRLRRRGLQLLAHALAPPA